jgi:hypothetical protein
MPCGYYKPTRDKVRDRRFMSLKGRELDIGRRRGSALLLIGTLLLSI